MLNESSRVEDAVAQATAEPTRSEREHRLVEQLRLGDPQAYETLVREYGKAMLAVTRRLLRNEHDAEDALQEAFLQVFRSIGSFRRESSLATWLHRIAWNAALLKIRRGNRHPEVSIEPMMPTYDETGHRVGPVPSLTATPESDLERSEIRARVRACVESLPLRYRTVVVLRDLEDRSTRETAQVLGVSETLVKVRLHRARKALAVMIGQRVPELAAGA
jgi:RNA polymerase sigma-70 factor (ECF subfamily)